MTLILGIESSCDETAAAVVKDGTTILSDVVASQITLHAEFGGVFPEVASRAHVENAVPVITQALAQANVKLAEIDAIAVTQGPGLPGSLVVGMNLAKGLALASGKKIIGVNHLEGHIHSLWLNNLLVQSTLPEDERKQNEGEIQLPAVILIASGGHTSLAVMHDHGKYEVIGRTLDDAAGEAFDKVGRMLGLPYPGGPSIQAAAISGNEEAYPFPRSWLKTDDGEESYDFSFSGLKTAVLRTLENLQPGFKPDDVLDPSLSVNDLAASFQAAVVEVLVQKTLQAASSHKAKEIHIAGGVSANTVLRAAMNAASPIPVRVPPLSLCTDNAVMIASAGHFKYLRGEFSSLAMDVLPNWELVKS